MRSIRSVFKRITIVLMILFGLFANCNQLGKGISDNPEFAKYIAAYTTGILSKTAEIQVRFISEALNNISLAEYVENDLFEFSPDIDGKVELADDFTLKFKPNEALEPGTEYTATLKMGKILNVKKDLSKFTFKFRTIAQNFDIETSGFISDIADKGKSVTVLGQIYTADVEDADDIRKILSAKIKGKQAKIIVNSEENGLVHKFEIPDIERTKERTEMKIAYNGDAINVDKSGELEMEIPALGEFLYMGNQIVQSPNQYLQVQFSDPIDYNQNLDGLIRVGGMFNLKYIVEGNIVKIYPSGRLTGTHSVVIDKSIRNINGKFLKSNINFDAFFEKLKPEVRMVGKGSILPSGENGLLVPFEAVNLKAVDVKVIKIYEKNIGQFLQTNDLDGSDQLRRVGVPIVHKTVSLEASGVADFGKWNRFTLNLSELAKTEPGAIYRIEISFRRHQALYDCDKTVDEADDKPLKTEDWSLPESETSYWDYYYDDDYYSDNWWENRDNPCHKAYYTNERTVSQNILMSDLGVIAKIGADKKWNIFVTNLLTAMPESGAKVKLLTYQQKLITEASTDSKGQVVFPLEERPYFVLVEKGTQKAWLKLSEGGSLSVSRFDVGGAAVSNGLKGFIYGERGVWRPGDSIYLTFVLAENLAPLPASHPVVFELTDPQSKFVTKIIETKSATGFYNFRTATAAEAPTGNYLATVSVGGAKFTKTIKIETVKPNRLKIDFKFPSDYLVRNVPVAAKMAVKWLHGAIASDLNTTVQVTVKQSQTKFKGYTDYTFDDASKVFSAEEQNVVTAKTDAAGLLNFQAKLDIGNNAPGMLNASFVTKVFEKGGDFSIDQMNVPYYPYAEMVGIKLPKGDEARGMLLTDTAHRVDLVILNPEGKNVAETREVEVAFYKLEWRWWWDKNEDYLPNFEGSYAPEAISKKVIKVTGGKGAWSIKVKYPDWGRYLVYAKNLQTGHSSTKIVYIDWPGWAGRAGKDQEGAAMLSFDTDKKLYKTGETINVTIPGSNKGRALVTLENGSGIVDARWVETQAGNSTFSFVATEAMTPNVFIHVSLLQPHAQTENDLPIRMYGIIPVDIENPATKLQPILAAPDVTEPEKEFTVTVSEANNQQMTYTLAVVDEGLLGLTRFKTPNPWTTFYAREALGVRTWDMFDYVIGAYGGKMERLLSIGGGEDAIIDKANKAKRFEPVVLFYGPFTLKGGKKAHQIKLPKYIGEVRVMVVAGNSKAYGSAEKQIPVKSNLMAMTTLPRVVGPGETMKLPVTVFAGSDAVKNVSLKITTNSLVSVMGEASKQVEFTVQGEKMAYFDLKIGDKTGIAKITVEAESGGFKSVSETEIDVRNANSLVSNAYAYEIEPGANLKADFSSFGLPGTNTAKLEISGVPPINIEKHLKYLITYPHGCVEQTTSSVFPQLFLNDITTLSKEQKLQTEKNIGEGIKQLAKFQLYNGGMAYWPGSSDANAWGSIYAYHFLVEAKNKGYTVPNELFNGLSKFLSEQASNWNDEGERSQLVQAYQLYVLALAGKPDKSAMNRLQQNENLKNDAKWRLAAAFQITGKNKIAEELIAGLKFEVPKYFEMGGSFGSDVRDKAMMLETLVLMRKSTQAVSLMVEVSEALSAQTMYPTQTAAYALIAASKYISNYALTDKVNASYEYNGKNIEIVADKPIAIVDLPLTGSGAQKLQIKNNGKGVLFAKVVVSGIPAADESIAAANSDLIIETLYTDLDGKSVDISKLKAGTDFTAVVRVTNSGNKGDYEQLALTQVFASGWEIINGRIFETDEEGNQKSAADYIDVRDDRVYTYFSLRNSETKTFKVTLNATYNGRFRLPATKVEAMYDPAVYARNVGRWVVIE